MTERLSSNHRVLRNDLGLEVHRLLIVAVRFAGEKCLGERDDASVWHYLSLVSDDVFVYSENSDSVLFFDD